MRQLPEAVCIRRFPCEQFARAALQHFSVNFDNSVCTIKHTHHDVTDGLVDACLVEDFGAVGGGEDDQPDRAVEAVHLCEQLVEGLLALVVAADAARMSPAQRIDELRAPMPWLSKAYEASATLCRADSMAASMAG